MKKIILMLAVMILACPLFAEDSMPATYKQEIILIAVVPPAVEVNCVVSSSDGDYISNAINNIYVDKGIVINLINMSPEALDTALDACIVKVSDEINGGAFYKGSNAGILIRTSKSQFKITHNGVAYTSLDGYGKVEIKKIMKALAVNAGSVTITT